MPGSKVPGPKSPDAKRPEKRAPNGLQGNPCPNGKDELQVRKRIFTVALDLSHLDGRVLRPVTSPPMRLFAHRRSIAGTVLLAFLFVLTTPALAVVRQAVDPLAYAKICRVDVAAIADVTDTGVPATPAGTHKPAHAHCLLCVGAVTPPLELSVALTAESPRSRPVLWQDHSRVAARDAAALQPLNPRAPPRP